jgi:hypothetical protein
MPSLTEAIWGDDRRAQALIVRAFGVADLLRMRRRP